jgi:hypothetical protein
MLQHLFDVVLQLVPFVTADVRMVHIEPLYAQLYPERRDKRVVYLLQRCESGFGHGAKVTVGREAAKR